MDPCSYVLTILCCATALVGQGVMARARGKLMQLWLQSHSLSFGEGWCSVTRRTRVSMGSRVRAMLGLGVGSGLRPAFGFDTLIRMDRHTLGWVYTKCLNWCCSKWPGMPCTSIIYPPCIYKCLNWCCSKWPWKMITRMEIEGR